MGQHGLWIPAAERAEAKAVQNVVAVAVAMARLEIIAVDVVVRNEDPEAHLMVPSAVARNEDPEVHLVVPSVVVRSVGPVALPAEVRNAAVEAVRTLSIIFTRRRRPPFL